MYIYIYTYIHVHSVDYVRGFFNCPFRSDGFKFTWWKCYLEIIRSFFSLSLSLFSSSLVPRHRAPASLVGNISRISRHRSAPSRGTLQLCLFIRDSSTLLREEGRFERRLKEDEMHTGMKYYFWLIYDFKCRGFFFFPLLFLFLFFQLDVRWFIFFFGRDRFFFRDRFFALR